MNGINSILCVVDPTGPSGGPAIEKAATLAQAFNAALELLICSVPPMAADQDAVLSRQLEAWAVPLRTRCPGISTRLIIGESLHRALLQYIQGSTFDLVVKDTHPQAFAQRAFGRTVDWHLVRACAPPLLLTHPRAWNPTPVILACIDPTHFKDPGAVLDHCLLQDAQDLSNRLGGTLHALHAYRHHIPATINGRESLANALSCEPLEAEALARLARVGALAEEFGVSPNHMHLSTTGVRDAIVRTAVEQHTDIVVMGALSRATPLTLCLGHEADHVLDQLQCDVLVVKVPDFTSAR